MKHKLTIFLIILALSLSACGEMGERKSDNVIIAEKTPVGTSISSLTSKPDTEKKDKDASSEY